MTDDIGRQMQSEDFWAEVIHRSKNQLSDINVRKFQEWRTMVGDREINRLLRLMELLLSPDNHDFEIKFFFDWVNCRINGRLLFSCFRSSGKTIIKQGMKGEIYCVPVLYVIIRYLIDDTRRLSPSDYKEKEIDISQIFQPNFTQHYKLETVIK
ncbi:hypothetical protein ER69_00795 [Salmonella enterica subsp. enterica serovar Newport]|nr:hypothetical protein [Salmonella enterica subsp. enterica serovar Newport]